MPSVSGPSQLDLTPGRTVDLTAFGVPAHKISIWKTVAFVELDRLYQTIAIEASGMAKKKTSGARKVKRAMHELKHGTLKSGRSGKKVKSRKQAIAIGLSEARKSGARIPKKKKQASRKKK
jgi:hypothetical protein